MQEHVTTDECTFCLEVHALEGEKYIVEPERALTQALVKVRAFVSINAHFLTPSQLPRLRLRSLEAYPHSPTILAANTRFLDRRNHPLCGAGAGGK